MVKLFKSRNNKKSSDIKVSAGDTKVVQKAKKHSKKPKLALGKKKNAGFKGERGFTNPFGYTDTDPYIFVGGNGVFSVFDVLFQYGTNNPANVGWANIVLPRDQINHGDVLIVQRQQGMEKSTEDPIIEKKLKSYVTTLSNDNTPSARDDAQNRQRIQDMRLAGQLSGMDDTIVDSDMRLIIKAKTPQDVELALDELKANYKNNDIKGIILVRRIGVQLKELKNLLTTVSADGWHNSDMATVSAGRLFLPSSGFSDSVGVYVGTDIRALLLNNPAIIDFRGVRNAVIFMGGVSPIVDIAGSDSPILAQSGGSAVAHVIAESNYLSGQRTHHIVLSSDFDYRSPDSLSFDMTKETINPLEVFGTPETVQFDANTNFDKIVTMLMVLVKQTGNVQMEMELKSLLIDWFINRANGQGLYTAHPNTESHLARRILATPDDHEHYPRLSNFITELSANVSKRSSEGERARERADFLYQSIKTAARSYGSVFDNPTSLPDSYRASDRNIYYDLSSISEDKILKGVLLINTLAYVTNRALAGELIVVHGLDSADVPPEALRPYRERIDRKHIGLITVYEDSENKQINPQTCVGFSGRLSRQDAIVLGGLTKEELSYINDSWQQPLPQQVSNQLLAMRQGILYFYRSSDSVGALIDTHLML